MSSRDLSACLWPQNLSFRHTWPLGAENSNLVLDHEHLFPREAPEPTLQGFLRVTNFRVKSPNTGTLSVKPKYQKAGKQEESSTALQSLQVTDPWVTSLGFPDSPQSVATRLLGQLGGTVLFLSYWLLSDNVCDRPASCPRQRKRITERGIRELSSTPPHLW